MKHQKIMKQLLVGILVLGMIGQAVPSHGDSVTVSSGNITVLVNGQAAELKDTAGNKAEAVNYEGSVYLPIRGVAEALGLTAAYDSSSKTVNITGTVAASPQGAGTPPTGIPPTGAPPTGTPPTGTPPTAMAQSGGTSASAAVAVKKQIDVVFDAIQVSLNGTATVLKDASGNTVTPFNYNGTIYLPVRAVAEALGVAVTYDTAAATVQLGSGAPGGAPGAGGGSSSEATGTAEVTQTGGSETLSGKTLTADGADESVVMVSGGGTLVLKDAILNKTGESSSEESSNFSGVNAGILASDGSQITVSDTTINTAGDGANAIFSTGDKTTITVSNVTIKTTANSSRGLDATYNGTILAEDVSIDTAGAHCGALATDRGEGTVTAKRVIAKTSGEGSPGIYSTGAITVSDSTLTASGSEAAVVEGKNSITLTDVVLSGALKCGAMIYQSFSGDAGIGSGSFTMTGGSLTAAVGPLFYSTNTHAIITLKSAELKGASGILIQAGADRWGTTGSNGADVDLNASDQILTGDVTADSISTVAMVLTEESVLKGAVNSGNTAKSVTLALQNKSVWQVTGTSYLSGLTIEDADLTCIVDNGNTIYYDGENEDNAWLGGTTHALSGGGSLTPMA